MSAVAMPTIPVTPQVAPPTPVPPPNSTFPVPHLTLTDIRRFTVAEYMKLVEIGMFDEGNRVELLDGWIVEIEPMNPPHSAIPSNCVAYLVRILPDGSACRRQSSTRTADSRPEPDVAVVRGRQFDYLTRDPTPDDTPLLIEVDDSPLMRDRGTKMTVYGRAGYAVYWILNVLEGVLEVDTEPTSPADEPGYRQSRTYTLDESVPLVLDGVQVASIPVRELLP